MITKIGTRVGAISHADKDKLYLFGYGIYDGDHIPPEGRGFGLPNPRIKLDNGEYVYGCECWWGSEEKVKSMIGGREIIEVDINGERKQHRESV